MAKKKPPQSAPADAKANGWKPPFPGAKPPFKESKGKTAPAGKGAAAKGAAGKAAPAKGLPPWLAKPGAKPAKKKGK
jgi:hypothetical protein